MAYVKLLDGSSEDEEEFSPSIKKKETKEDIVITTIGSFGPYQTWLCVVGFLLNVVHCWLSLSLKFVGLPPKFHCQKDNPDADNNPCTVAFGNVSETCQAFIYEKDEVTGLTETIVERWDLVCQKSGLENVAQSVFFTGCLIGVFLAGIMADLMGRKRICIFLVSVFIISGVLGGLVNSWYTWLALRFVVGAATIGMVTVRYTIQVEMIGGAWRSWANTFTSTGWVVGYMSLPFLAYCVPNMRQMEILIGLSALPLLILLLFCHPESPKWLLAAGKVTKAVTILNRVAAWNKKQKIGEKSAQKLADSQKETTKLKVRPVSESISTVFTRPYKTLRRNLLIMCLCWFSFGMAYFGLALHTPELGSNVFLVFFIGGLMDVPVILIGPFLLNHAGRRLCMAGSLLLGAFCLLTTVFLPSTSKLIIVMAILGKMGVGMAFDTGYVWSSEMFPTVIRNSSLSICSSSARLGAIIAPLVSIADSYRPGTSILVYGLVAFLAGILSMKLSPETKTSKTLPDTLEEGEIAANRTDA